MWSDTNGARQIDYAEILDVGVVVLYFDELDSIVQTRFNQVASNPGFFVLDVLHNDNGEITFLKSPILAWLYASEAGTLPITLEGINHGSKKSVAILTPEGQVIISMDGSYPSIDAYKKHGFHTVGQE